MRKGWVKGVNDFCLPLEIYRELDMDDTNLCFVPATVCLFTKEDFNVQENCTLKRYMHVAHCSTSIFHITTWQRHIERAPLCDLIASVNLFIR